jgi:hypothetical protein
MSAELRLYRVLHERMAGWCNDPARVSVEVSPEYVVAESPEEAQRLSTLPAVTSVFEVGQLPEGAGVVPWAEPLTEEHVGSVVDRFSRGYAHAECSCGWRGPSRTGLTARGAAAGADLEEHYREVNGGA